MGEGEGDNIEIRPFNVAGHEQGTCCHPPPWHGMPPLLMSMWHAALVVLDVACHPCIVDVACHPRRPWHGMPHLSSWHGMLPLSSILVVVNVVHAVLILIVDVACIVVLVVLVNVECVVVLIVAGVDVARGCPHCHSHHHTVSLTWQCSFKLYWA